MNNRQGVQETTFADLFEGISVWRRIVGGALLAPVWVIGGMWYAKVRGRIPADMRLPDDPRAIAMAIVGLAIIGAAVGGALALKAVAQSQLDDHRSVNPFLQALFGFGRWSAFLFWLPMIVGVGVITVGLIAHA